MAENEKRCKNCEFYDITSSVEGNGQCRFSAPLPTIKSAMMSDKFFNEASLNWPHVQPNDWCGQYRDKNRQ